MSERRLAAIMFTDIVGYTALMSKDEDAAFKLLRNNKHLQKTRIEKYKGEMLKEIGDGILASFYSASNAVRCAREIQTEALKQNIPLRIGIHQGEVVFESGDVLGDGVNIASRLEEITDRGSISISKAVYKEIKNKYGFVVEEAGERTLKNVEEPVEVFKVVLDAAISPQTDKKTGVEDPTTSIAVLPFVNMSADPEQEYFCDGITEEIINALNNIENLKVIARTSAFMFKGKNEDIRSIGRKLNVNSLLEGSVRRSGNRLRITAQLINVSDGSHFWSERFDREIKDVFEIQDEISLAIVKKLKIQLFESEKKKVFKSHTQSVDAYKLYLKGLYQWNKRTKEGMNSSISFFEKALEQDPGYVLAYTGMAKAFITLTDWGIKLSKDMLPQARQYLNKAMEIDDKLADIYVTFSYLNLCEWKLRECEEYFYKAIKLDPNLSIAYHTFGLYNGLTGNFKKAVENNRKARELDPFSMIYNFAYGFILYLSGKLNEAIDQLQKTLLIDPTFKPAILFSMHSYMLMGKDREAVIEFQKILRINPENEQYIPLIQDLFDTSGKEGFLRWFINHGLNYYQGKYNHYYHKAVCYALLKEKEKALDCLEEGLNIKSFRMLALKVEPGYESLRNEDRYQNMLNKIGYTE